MADRDKGAKTMPAKPVPAKTMGAKQMAETIATSATSDFKAACKRGAGRRKISLAEYARLALSERLTADGIRHRRPADGGAS